MGKKTPKWIATFAGCGLSRYAPGTVGSIAALPFAWLFWQYLPYFYALMLLVVFFAVGVWASETYSKQLEQHDHKSIVIDEAFGMFFVAGFAYFHIVDYLVAFALFRFFDIIKPPPINFFDKYLKGGFGIMFDDLVAALFAGVTLYLLHQFII